MVGCQVDGCEYLMASKEAATFLGWMASYARKYKIELVV